MQDTEADTTTIVSRYHPLTRGARRALQEYGIVSEETVREAGLQTVVEVESRPPEDVLDEHDLTVDEDPDDVYLADNGDRVEIYDGRGSVFVDGVEAGISPDEAREHAES